MISDHWRGSSMVWNPSAPNPCKRTIYSPVLVAEGEESKLYGTNVERQGTNTEENISQLFEQAHNNTKVFKMLRDRMRQNRFNSFMLKLRGCINKKMKRCDVLQKSGSYLDIKDKFIWYDSLNNILNTRLKNRKIDK